MMIRIIMTSTFDSGFIFLSVFFFGSVFVHTVKSSLNLNQSE